MPSLATITIDVVSRETGIDIATIRSYQGLGLVPKPRRIAGSLLLYSTDDVSVVVFVHRALGLGFSLQAVRDLLRMANGRPGDCAEVHALAREHLRDIKRRLTELRSMEKALAPLVARCSPNLPVEDCPILQALAHRPNATE
jgi:MerR family mercuric resistance operon transcriptional regulator